MDSLYLGRTWHAQNSLEFGYWFTNLGVSWQQQMWPGMGETHQWQGNANLGLHLGTIMASAGTTCLRSCLFPEYAIQWEAGDLYQVNWMLSKNELGSWSLTIGQRLSVPGNISFSLGWRFPSKLFAAGIQVGFSGFSAEASQSWHPYRPSTRWASGAWSL
jgi:hypothetical protein